MLITLELETNCNHGGTKPDLVAPTPPTISALAPTRHFPPKLRQPRIIGPSNGINFFKTNKNILLPQTSMETDKEHKIIVLFYGKTNNFENIFHF